MDETSNNSKASALQTPLAVIALLISAFEVSFVTAAINTSGAIQWLFSVAATLGLPGVAYGFYRLLTDRPEALLSPRDFNSGREMAEVIQALRQTAAKAAVEAQGVSASAEELQVLAERTKISYEAIAGLQGQLEAQAAEIRKSKALAYFLAG